MGRERERRVRVDWGASMLELVEDDGWQMELSQHVELYGDHKRVMWFDQPTSLDGGGSVNVNVLQAREWLIGKGRGAVITAVLGPMCSGKSTLPYWMADSGNVWIDIWQHAHGAARAGGRTLKIRSADGELRDTGIKTRLMENIEELLGLTKVRGGTMFWVDEVNFMGGVSEESLVSLRDWANKMGVTVVMSGLDLTFLNEPWPNTRLLVEAADQVLVLAARCDYEECGQPAWFSQRMVRLADGRVRPAAVGDPIEVVGGGDDGLVEVFYYPACADCHQILSVEEAREFNGVNDEGK